jgi:hypothetical protein
MTEKSVDRCEICDHPESSCRHLSEPRAFWLCPHRALNENDMDKFKLYRPPDSIGTYTDEIEPCHEAVCMQDIRHAYHIKTIGDDVYVAATTSLHLSGLSIMALDQSATKVMYSLQTRHLMEIPKEAHIRLCEHLYIDDSSILSIFEARCPLTTRKSDGQSLPQPCKCTSEYLHNKYIRHKHYVRCRQCYAKWREGTPRFCFMVDEQKDMVNGHTSAKIRLFVVWPLGLATRGNYAWGCSTLEVQELGEQNLAFDTSQRTQEQTRQCVFAELLSGAGMSPTVSRQPSATRDRGAKLAWKQPQATTKKALALTSSVGLCSRHEASGISKSVANCDSTKREAEPADKQSRYCVPSWPRRFLSKFAATQGKY